ncbi:hypothetical protein HZA42_00415 [Candidatus Peregrinibacteria bacterium]|nr:hypothetical protein [Candidatus Peregrinibacteria bacterium]
MPQELAALFIGACAAESQFSEIGENKVHAAGPWQLMPKAAEEFGLMGTTRIWVKKGPKKKKKVPRDIPFDHRNDFALATPVAVKVIEKFYRELANQDKGPEGNKSTVVMDMQQMYGVSDEDFLHQAVVNGYQTGPSRVKKMCEWFMTNYPPTAVEKILGKGPYGKDLYTLMTYVYIQSGNDLNFGKQSRDYVIRAMAMKELFASADEGKTLEFGNDSYVPPAPSREPESEMSGSVTAMVRNGMRNGHMQTLGVGAVTAATAVLIGKTLENNPRLKRRDLVVGALGLGAAFGGRAFANRQAEQPKEVPVSPEQQPENQFAPYVLDEQGIAQALLASKQQMLKGVPMRTKAERRKLKDRLATGLEIAERLHLLKFKTVEDIKKADLKDVPQYSSPHYRLRGVGMLDDGNTGNDDRYTCCYPHTESLINRISQELNEELYAQGFPRRFNVRLIVKGLSRSEAFQEALRKINPYAARGDSPHMYGHSFDIHKSKFDIVDTSTSSFKFGLVKAWKYFLGFFGGEFPCDRTFGFVASFFPCQNFAF